MNINSIFGHLEVGGKTLKTKMMENHPTFKRTCAIDSFMADFLLICLILQWNPAYMDKPPRSAKEYVRMYIIIFHSSIIKSEQK